MRRKIGIVVFLGISLASFFILALSGFYSQTVLKKLTESYQEEIMSALESRVKLFYKMLYFAEKKMSKEASRGLLKAVKRVDEIGVRNLNADILKKIARECGVDEVYIINENGVVEATSFEPDSNLNLFALSEDFEAFLRSVYGRGKVFVGRIDTSSVTGALNLYAYYGPKGKDYLVEVSLNVKKYFLRNYSKEDYEYLFGKFFVEAPNLGKYLKYVYIFHVSKRGAFSINSPGTKSDEIRLSFGRLRKGEILKKKDGEIIRLFKRVDIEEGDFDWATGNYIEAGFDFSSLTAYRNEFILASILIFLLVSTVAFLLFSKALNRLFLVRVFKINQTLRNIAQGDFSQRLHIEGNDELSEIARNVNIMAKAIRKSHEELERKVWERTRDLMKRNKELQEAKREMEILSRTDPLTGLFNRRAMMEKLREEEVRFKRNREPFSLVMIDVDDFKKVNDRYGHSVGDVILREVALKIRDNLRAQDVVARWGGDEFLLLLPQTSMEGARVVCENLARRISDVEIPGEGVKLKIGMTFGISSYGPSKTIEKCLREADQALYKGKSTGKGKVEVYRNIEEKLF